MLEAIMSIIILFIIWAITRWISPPHKYKIKYPFPFMYNQFIKEDKDKKEDLDL